MKKIFAALGPRHRAGNRNPDHASQRHLLQLRSAQLERGSGPSPPSRRRVSGQIGEPGGRGGKSPPRSQPSPHARTCPPHVAEPPGDWDRSRGAPAPSPHGWRASLPHCSVAGAPSRSCITWRPIDQPRIDVDHREGGRACAARAREHNPHGVVRRLSGGATGPGPQRQRSGRFHG